VIACDVLEHVLTVPHGNDLKVKMELPPDASPADRLGLAGREDHQRIYTPDFFAFLITSRARLSISLCDHDPVSV
jgi:hypothetical protein